MIKIIINNHRWYVNPRTLIIYENEDMTGQSFHINDRNVTQQEREQIKRYFR